MTIRRMTLEDLQMVLGWAADEGWNPGIDDATAFFTADPEGFFISEVAGKPAAAISVVNHNAEFAFLGLYLCRPEFRGQGLGIDIWRFGLEHAGARCVGLDGVPQQQDNYMKSGFTKTGRTIRYQGTLPKKTTEHIRLANTSDIPALVKADALATGFTRSAFSRSWLSNTQTRQTSLLLDGSDTLAFATSRQCADGVKVGPLQAETAEQALDLAMATQRESSASSIFVDVPDHSEHLSELLERHGFTPVFETARMYSHTPPDNRTPSYCAIATMELG